MKITWDEKAKAVYIHLEDTGGEKVEGTEQVSGTINIDYIRGCPVGIEILCATKPVLEELG